MSPQQEILTLHGRCLSSGLAQGETFVHHDVLDRNDEYYYIESHQVNEEQHRLEKAFERINHDLDKLTTQVEKEMDAEIASIFEAHQLMLQDPTLRDDVMRGITDDLVSAGGAVRTVFHRWEQRFRSLEAEIARQKGDDLRDLARRLVNALAGVDVHALKNLPAGRVLVARRLLPSDTVYLSRQSAAAALLEFGGIGSHAALFAREIGLPCITQLPNLLHTIPSGVETLVDADAAEVIVHPDQERRTEFESKVKQRKLTESRAQRNARDPAMSRDGITIPVLANITCHDDTRDALANGAEGVGLYRTEQIYVARQTPPEVGELLEAMRHTLAPLKYGPVYIRLLDAGADKPLPFLESFRESNPALGRRGVRLLRHYPDLLQTQLLSLLHLSSEFDVRILVPMVTLETDMESVREALENCGRQMNLSGLPPLGAMIETPAAALSAGKLAPFVDFFSLGTNDLTQYTFAADRENEGVDEYFADSHEVILRLLELIHNDAPDIPLSICGELAGRPDHIEKLLRCGIDSLSVAPPLVPHIKEAIRTATVSRADTLPGL